MGKRRPLTGTLTVEWVDGADPDDDTVPSNFGWISADSEPPLPPARLLVLLRGLAAALEEEIAYTDDPWLPPEAPRG